MHIQLEPFLKKKKKKESFTVKEKMLVAKF